MRFSKLTYILLLLCFFSLSAQKKNVILYIGDGFGVAPKTAARLALGQGTTGKRLSTDPNFQVMALDKLKFAGMITTHSLNSWVTDSAPGAACYASGQAGKTDNEVITMNPTNWQATQTILEAAKKAGYAVGLVSTARITHATPAAFASHIWNRDLEDYIAAQYISTSQAEYESIFNSSTITASKYDANRDWILPSTKVGIELDVLIGGGARHFLPKSYESPNSALKDKNGVQIQKNSKAVTFGKGNRADDVDLIEIAKSKGYVYTNTRDALMNIDLTQFTPSNNKKLLCLTHKSHVSYEQDRQLFYDYEPMIAEMTQMAIEVLKRKSSKGFFLMVESGRIDHLEHANCGGIGYTTDSTGKKTNFTITADKAAIPEDGTYSGAAAYPGIYGSDYMIKEVIAYDYAIAEGRKLLTNTNEQTLILTTSDHECGGFGVVGLHDEADAQKNGTKIRTYSKQPTKTAYNPTPVGITRGDSDINGWFPNYSMVDFQGFQYPKVDSNGRRIVISFASNPTTNGNGTKIGGTPGNHTPQDILVLADDNVNGTYASRIAGKGLLDNTDLTPIMEDFLAVKLTTSIIENDDKKDNKGLIISPNPTNSDSNVNITFELTNTSTASLSIFNSAGALVKEMNLGSISGVNTINWDKKDNFGNVLPNGSYYFKVSTNDTELINSAIVLK